MLLVYDGTFEGYLSVVFEVYKRKLEPTEITAKEHFQHTMFTSKEEITTDFDHAERVWKGLQQKLKPELNQIPYSAWLSGEKGIEMALLEYIRQAFILPLSVEGNFGDANILTVRKAARRVMREAMRVLQFVRFQCTLDGIYFSAISPEYDVLPLTIKQLQNRFADQNWVVYDLKRDYGFYYNKKTSEEITLADKSFSRSTGAMPANLLQEEEGFYQQAWMGYCKSTTIRERLNPKLQRQHMPKRFWKYLTEKKR